MPDRSMARCSRCHMDDDTYGQDHIHIGKLESGTHVYDWKHKTIEGCLFALGMELSLLREREDRT